MKLRTLLQAIVATGALSFALGANADSITLSSVSGVGGGPSTWTYSYTFANSTLVTGDFFTINDFGVLAAGSVDPVGPAGGTWARTQALTGLNSLAAFDDPTVLNVTYTWTSAVPVPVVGTPSFSFSLVSTLGSVPFQLHDYTTQDHSTTDFPALSRVSGQVRGPLSVPDGGLTIAFLGSAMVGLGLLRRKLSAFCS